MTLYAVPNGKRYHDSMFCEGLNSWSVAWGTDVPPPIITMRRAVQRGLTPCGTCKPPPLLRVVS